MKGKAKMMYQASEANDPKSLDKMRSFFGPQHVDQQIRQAIQVCWMALPAERKNANEVEKEIRRVMERALGNLREDFASLGFAVDPPTGDKSS
jgi:hypothetical protein